MHRLTGTAVDADEGILRSRKVSIAIVTLIVVASALASAGSWTGATGSIRGAATWPAAALRRLAGDVDEVEADLAPEPMTEEDLTELVARIEAGIGSATHIEDLRSAIDARFSDLSELTDAGSKILVAVSAPARCNM